MHCKLAGPTNTSAILCINATSSLHGISRGSNSTVEILVAAHFCILHITLCSISERAAGSWLHNGLVMVATTWYRILCSLHQRLPAQMMYSLQDPVVLHAYLDKSRTVITHTFALFRNSVSISCADIWQGGVQNDLLFYLIFQTQQASKEFFVKLNHDT